MSLLFWICLFGLVCTYVGYPVWVWGLARICPRPIQFSSPPPESLSVILVAHNEADVLPEKIQSLLDSSIADRIVEVVVVSDASTDATDEAVRRLPDPRVRLQTGHDRRGKAACINQAVAGASAEILVLTDARQPVDAEALARLARCLEDPSVGVASGQLVFRSGTGGGVIEEGMGAYWRYETFIRRQESRVGSVPGATGALYAIRRALFVPIPEDLVLDDVFVPMKVVEQSHRCVLAEGAYVYDRVSETVSMEWTRKRRTLAGCIQLAQRYPRWLLHGPFFGHKIARLASPLLLIGLLAGSWAVSGWLFWGQVTAYATLAAVWIPVSRGAQVPLLGTAVFFAGLNVATLAALWDGLRGHYDPAWKQAKR